MDTHVRTIAEEAARLLLQRFGKEHPGWRDEQTPLDAIAEWLGLAIATFHAADYPKGTYGFIDPDEGENLIWLCRDMPETFRRFTLAHEIGHVVLHCHHQHIAPMLGALATQLVALEAQQHVPDVSREDPCHDNDVREELTDLAEQSLEAVGIGMTYDPRSQREIMANIFAAELLMPLAQVRSFYLEQQVPPHTLATRFAVSNAAILNRLAGLLKASATVAGVQVDDQTETEAQQTTAIPSHMSNTSILPVAAQFIVQKQYDEFQQAAIEAPTPALIVAGPGSGKTSTLIGRIEYLLSTLNVPPQHILALTFSRKAAKEMEERLQKIVGETAVLPKVSTFHAFCADLLRQHGMRVGLRADFALIDEAEGYFLLRQQANKMRLLHYIKLQSPTYYFPELLKAISRAKDELISPQEYARLAQQMQTSAYDEEATEEAQKALEVAHVYALYEKALLKRGDTDFGGLLMLAVQLLRQCPDVLREQQQKYQQVLVDEFQDVNRASGILLRELAGEGHRVWVVGDANQAIYRFRGASPANISQFKTDFPRAVTLPLSRNYRSRPDLVAMAEAFRCRQLELGQEPGKNQPVRLTDPDSYVSLATAADDRSELAGLAQDIRSKHRKGYAYKDIVVLCRTRALVQKVTRVLTAAGLPVIERSSVLEQEHVKDLLALISLLIDPCAMGLLRAARQPEHPLTQADIETLLLYAQEQKSSPRSLLFNGEWPQTISIAGQSSLQRLSNILQTLLRTPNIWSLLAQYLLIETSLLRDLLSNREDERNATLLADYDLLLQLARRYDAQQQARTRSAGQQEDEQGGLAATATVPIEEQVKGFLEYLTILVMLRQDGSRAGNDESEQEQADVLRVMTVHASKGLEFPVVYLPGLLQRRFPAQARSSPITAPTGMLPEGCVGHAAHESSESCLFYVGVTRARDQLVLSYSERYGKQKYKRSPYLDTLEAGLPDEHITRIEWSSDNKDEQNSDEQSNMPSAHPGTYFLQQMKAPTFHAADIEAYQRCPRAYLYSTIYHFTGEKNAYQRFWHATQKTVEELQKQTREANSIQQRPSMQQDLRELYTQHWQAAGGHMEPFAALYEEHGHEIVEAVQRDLSIQEQTNWYLRQRFAVDIAGQQIHVTVDRTETSMQAPVKFVRTRFGRRKDKPPAETRELLYKLAYQQQHPGQEVELHSHNMSTGEVVPIKMTAKKEQSLYDAVEQSLAGLARDEYPATPAEPLRCPACPFFWICPA